MLLKKAFYNRKPVEKPRMAKETSSTEAGHDAELKREMMAKRPAISKIKALLTVSFQKRRKWIESLGGKGTVKRILEAYPGFKDYNQVCGSWIIRMFLLPVHNLGSCLQTRRHIRHIFMRNSISVENIGQHFDDVQSAFNT